MTDPAGGAPRGDSSFARIDIVDEDSSVLKALGRLLQSVGVKSSGYASVEAYLEVGDLATATCLLIDPHIPELSWSALIERRSGTAPALPVICMAHRAEAELKRRLKGYVVGECLQKPFDQMELFRAISEVTTISLP